MSGCMFIFTAITILADSDHLIFSVLLKCHTVEEID